MFVHIIHLPMAAGLEPGRQARLGVGEARVRDADLVETERPPPRLDIRGKGRQAFLPARKIIVHQIHPGNDSGPSAHLHLPDEDATLAAGARLAAALPARLTVFLRGDLGAGKTTLTRGLLRGMGFTGRVKSPTYTLVEPYKDSRISVYHFDFYRFTHAEEFLEAGLEECFEGDGIRLVEWPDRAQPYLPAADLEVLLHVAPAGGRELALRALSPEGQRCLDDFNAVIAPPAARPAP